MATWSNSASMSNIVYFVASSLDGYIADSDGSLEWLTSIEGAPEEITSSFISTVGVQVMGSRTYEWLLENENILSHPEKWSQFFGEMKTVVFSSRSLPVPEMADIAFVDGSPAEHVDEITAWAGDGNIWLVAGGQLASQFLAANLIDRLEITYAPVVLGSGVKLFGDLSDFVRVDIRETLPSGNFIHVKCDVSLTSSGT